MIIGIAQINITWEDSKENMKKVEDFVKKALGNKINSTLFSEAFSTKF